MVYEKLGQPDRHRILDVSDDLGQRTRIDEDSVITHKAS